MKKITAFIKDRPVYFTGYIVTCTTYFSAHAGKMEDVYEVMIHIVASGLVGLISWAYPISRIINGLF